MEVLMKEKYGFVYLWRDRKHKRYYIGSHWGHEDDGYVCSSQWMKRSMKRRPQDFKRRILKYVYDRTILLEEEYKWLSMIKKEEIKVRYYNLYTHKFGHWTAYEDKTLTVKEKLRKANLGKKATEETKKKMAASQRKHHETVTDYDYLKGRPHSEETKEKMSEAQKGKARNPESLRKAAETLRSEEYKMKLSERYRSNPEMQSAKREAAKRSWETRREKRRVV
jgi:hypothetical protein